MKKVAGFRVDGDLLKKAKAKALESGIDLPNAVEDLLEKIANSKKCPVCMQQLKESK